MTFASALIYTYVGVFNFSWFKQIPLNEYAPNVWRSRDAVASRLNLRADNRAFHFRIFQPVVFAGSRTSIKKGWDIYNSKYHQQYQIDALFSRSC